MENESKNFSNDDLISILKDEPVFDKILEEWSCPSDYHYRSCPGCGHLYIHLKPIKKYLNNKWDYCEWCNEEFNLDNFKWD